MKNILVLGHKGMLGHMVVEYLHTHDVIVHILDKPWPECKDKIKEFYGCCIINCIGAIPQKTDNFDINWQLPIWLDLNVECKVIHPGTDCEMDKDEYEISKNIAANYIRNLSKNTKSLKTSILGPELNGNSSLFEWFLSQKEEVYGYTEAIWNGNTTLEWAKQCWQLINNWEDYNTETILQGEKISKYNLLKTIKKIYNKDIDIIPKDKGKDKCLKGKIKTKNIKDQLIELKNFK